MAAQEIISLEHGGVKGIWTPLERSRLILADVKELEIRRKEVVDLKLQLTIRQERVDVCHERILKERRISDMSIEAVSSAEIRAEKAEAKLNKWYRHPAFWTVCGVVLTVVLEVAAIKILHVSADTT